MAKLDDVERRRMRNKSVRSQVKTVMTRAQTLIETKEIEAGREAVSIAAATLDRAAKKGVIHPNQAARRKSRLAKGLNKAIEQQT